MPVKHVKCQTKLTLRKRALFDVLQDKTQKWSKGVIQVSGVSWDSFHIYIIFQKPVDFLVLSKCS